MNVRMRRSQFENYGGQMSCTQTRIITIEAKQIIKLSIETPIVKYALVQYHSLLVRAHVLFQFH